MELTITVLGAVLTTAAISTTSFFVGLFLGKESVYRAYRKYSNFDDYGGT